MGFRPGRFQPWRSGERGEEVLDRIYRIGGNGTSGTTGTTGTVADVASVAVVPYGVLRGRGAGERAREITK